MKKNHSKISVAFLYDDTLDSSDGVAQYVKIVGAWLPSQGHEVSYLVGETKLQQWAGGRVISLSKNINVTFNGNKLSMPLLSSKRNIKRVLRNGQFDVIHVQVPYSPLMAAKVIKAAPKNTAIIGTFHIYPAGWLSRFGSKLLRLWLLRSLKRIDQMLSVSEAAQSFARSGYHLQSQILPNVIELSKFKSSAKPEPMTIVFLGRLVERKGCLELLKAFALLKSELPEAKLIIGGKGPQLAKLQKFVSDNNLEDVEFKGFVPEEEKPQFLAQASVACFPAMYGECFGLVLVEAMAAGSLSVLGGDNPGYRSVLGERPETLINPRDTAEFADRLKQLLTDKKLAADLHQWQEASVKQYDIEVVGPALVEIYRSAIDIRNKNEHNESNEI